jgi:hypothetical protein
MKRPRRYRIAILAGAGLAFMLLPGSAMARELPPVKIYQSSENAQELGTVKKAKCKVRRRSSGKSFHAVARTTNGDYSVAVDILDFKGFDEHYNLEFGKIHTTVDVESTRGNDDYSNAYPFPGGTPPDSAGGLEFKRDGALMGIGIYGLPDADYEKGLVIGGVLRCKYRRR